VSATRQARYRPQCRCTAGPRRPHWPRTSHRPSHPRSVPHPFIEVTDRPCRGDIQHLLFVREHSPVVSLANRSASRPAVPGWAAIAHHNPGNPSGVATIPRNRPADEWTKLGPNLLEALRETCLEDLHALPSLGATVCRHVECLPALVALNASRIALPHSRSRFIAQSPDSLTVA
jgi:hypothetical protein